MKLHIQIRRIYQPDCTLGVLTTNTGLRLFTLELPWRENKSDISCIPSGEYGAFVRVSPKNGEVIELRGTGTRTNIQIHAGNFVSQIEGCVLVGLSIADINADGTPDVTSSRKALAKLLKEAKQCDQIVVSIL